MLETHQYLDNERLRKDLGMYGDWKRIDCGVYNELVSIVERKAKGLKEYNTKTPTKIYEWIHSNRDDHYIEYFRSDYRFKTRDAKEGKLDIRLAHKRTFKLIKMTRRDYIEKRWTRSGNDHLNVVVTHKSHVEREGTI